MQQDQAAPTVPQLHSITEDILSKLMAGQGVLVHCNHGFGRTGTILTAVIMVAFPSMQYASDVTGAVQEVRRIYNSYAVESEEQHQALSLYGKNMNS